MINIIKPVFVELPVQHLENTPVITRFTKITRLTNINIANVTSIEQSKGVWVDYASDYDYTLISFIGGKGSHIIDLPMKEVISRINTVLARSQNDE